MLLLSAHRLWTLPCLLVSPRPVLRPCLYRPTIPRALPALIFLMALFCCPGKPWLFICHFPFDRGFLAAFQTNCISWGIFSLWLLDHALLNQISYYIFL
ncbi:hypothetical protein C8J56DRAFT_940429 [Mycena floridula]|nr:hypothetical protein C8J56DRAFT_940429 [Mycena floridula]